MINFRYASKEKCLAEKRINTNQRYPTFVQRIFTAGDDEQFASSRVYKSLKATDDSIIDTNQFASNNLINRWSKNTSIDSRAVVDTFNYLFFKFKKGVFVKIADNKLVTFLPFTNVHFKNEWHSDVKVDPKYPNIKTFIDQSYRIAGYRPSNKIKPIDEWVSNNSMIRFDYQENDNNVASIYDMIKTLCDERKVADVELFINRRDYPIITIDETEPYNHLYGTKNLKLRSHTYNKYVPIMSGSSNDRFADILMPTFEDWNRAVYQSTGEVIPNSCRAYPEIKQIKWQDKIPKAVFRGATTGAGSTPETNQRLKALEIADPDLMDIGITKWNLRPRKHESDDYYRLIERPSYKKTEPLDLQDQSKYKYILTLEGHVAAYRLSYELSSGSVILLADSQWKMWYYKFLEPWIHYVPVKEDLSDLKERILWCRANDGKCQKIAANAKEFYAKFLGINSILDYLQKELFEVSEMVGPYDYFPNLLETQIADETAQLNDIKFSPVTLNHPIPPGPRCIGRLDGTLKMFRSVPFDSFRKVKHIASNKNGTVHLAQRNNVYIAVKTATNAGKSREHRHEAYIGLNAINSLVSEVPNFTYTYGLPENSDRVVVSEFIQGIPMYEWINSADFSFRSYVLIMIQINMALKVAQDNIGFIHYDLFPWNIMIQKLHQKIDFDYHVNPGLVLRVFTDIIPIMIDYGKSRALVYEEGKGLMDHGFVNLYKSHSMTDTITLLVTSLNLVKKKISVHQFNTLQSFMLHTGLEPNTDMYKHYGDLFNLPSGNLTPMSFVDFLINNFGPFNDEIQRINPKMKTYKMSRGNPIQTFAQMKTGNENKALMETLLYINESTFPNSTDEFFQRIIRKQLDRRLSMLNDDVKTKGSQMVKSRWKTITGYMKQTHKPTVQYPEMDYPIPDHIYLDINVTPEYINAHIINATPVKDNMAVIWQLCADAYLWESDEGKQHINDFVHIGVFGYLNAIASQNTLTELYKMKMKIKMK
jgi:hypothetical protein